MPRQRLKDLLSGGDRRSLGRSNEAEKIVLLEARRFPELIRCMWSDAPVVRMRAADAAEKVTVERPELLHPHKQELLGLLAETEQIELRWHLALMVPRLELSAREREGAAATLQSYLEDRSSIVKTCAMQGLADLARQDPNLQDTVKHILEESLHTGTAAMKARARKLLKKLKIEGRLSIAD
jgi:hypothetical protein